MSLVALAAVQEEVLSAVTPLETVTVALGDAHGLALAEEVRSGEAVPPFANTAMDGYAVRAADTAAATAESPVGLRVVGLLPAGRAPDRTVGEGEAIRIMTGAPIPPGADAIVMVERTTPIGDDGVLIAAAAAAGDHVRAAGGDLVAGASVFPVGTVLRRGLPRGARQRGGHVRPGHPPRPCRCALDGGRAGRRRGRPTPRARPDPGLESAHAPRVDPRGGL